MGADVRMGGEGVANIPGDAGVGVPQVVAFTCQMGGCCSLGLPQLQGRNGPGRRRVLAGRGSCQ